MSKMAYQRPIESSMDMITSFGGYNHNLSISDGEFYDTENLTTDRFPLVSQRGKRYKLGKKYSLANNPPEDISQWADMDMSEWLIAENDGLYAFKAVDPGNQQPCRFAVLKYDEAHDRWAKDLYSADYTCASDISMQYTINMGAQIVIFPAGIVYNTVQNTVKSIEATYSGGIEGVEASVVDHNGTTISSVTSSTTEPEEPENGDYWNDISKETYVLKRYSAASGMWATVQTYVKMYIDNSEFEEGDAVLISGGNWDNKVQKPDNQKYWVVYKKTSSYITVAATAKVFGSFNLGSITVKRELPLFDYITECNNRLWACRFGNDGHGETINELFATKLGDPTNWHYFSNTAVDSYYVSLGAGGKFTGAITYQGSPVFFKEDSVHRIYGYYPANFQLKSIVGYGVADGSNKSLVELNDTVYYLSNSGIAAYRGSIPINMGDMFGPIRYKNGIATGAGNRVYFSLQNGETRTLFSYDDRYGIWYREDELDVTDMFTYNSRVFCKTATDLISLSDFAGLESDEDKVEWSMDTGKIGFNTPWRKFITRVTFRIRLKLNTDAAFYIQYNSDGNWIHVADLKPTGAPEALAVPITPRRCDHFNIKIAGRGDFELISYTKFYEESNDYA